jgi:T5SS/PEP-CTERM-associated repeat protein
MRSSASFSRRALSCVNLVALLVAWSASGTARAAITQTGDVLPDPIEPFQDVYVGNMGIGSLRIDGGSTLESGTYVTIGNDIYGIGFATVSGPGSRWSFGRVVVGDQGVGRLAVLDGAVVETSGNYSAVGGSAESNGTVLVDGLGSVLSTHGPFDVGVEGVGLLQVSGGAIVSVPSDYTEIGAHGRVELDGGLLRTASLSNNGTITGHGTVQILNDQSLQNNGQIEAGNGQKLTFIFNPSYYNPQFRNLGVISVDGGELDLSDVQVENIGGMYNPYISGGIFLRNGVIRFPSSQNEGLRNLDRFVASGGVNEVYGWVENQREMLVTNESTLVFHGGADFYNGELVIHSGSTVELLGDTQLQGDVYLEIGDENGPTPIQALGQLYVCADLHVGLSEAYAPQVGDLFPLVHGPDVGGIFDDPELPDLPFGMLWQLDQNSSSIQLQIIATPDGDYNGDGTVDAADYSVWRDTLGSDSYLHADGSGNGLVDDDDYVVWKANFGVTAWPSPAPEGQGAMPLAAVPEPAAGVLLLVGAMLLVRCRPAPGRKTPPHVL